MRQLKASTLIATLTVAASALLSGCPSDNVPGTGGGLFGPLSVSAMGLTHMKNDGTTENSVTVSWSGVPLGTKDIDFNRSVDGSGLSLVTTFKKGEATYTDKSVTAGKTYQYSVTPFDDQGRKKGDSAKSGEIRLAPPSELSATAITSPKLDTFVNRADVPTFSWETVPAAELYWVQVRDRDDDKLVYGALTTKTSIEFGAASPVTVPGKLANVFQTAQSGFTNGKQYRLMISAVAMEPKGGDLNTVRNLAIRDSQTVTIAVR